MFSRSLSVKTSPGFTITGVGPPADLEKRKSQEMSSGEVWVPDCPPTQRPLPSFILIFVTENKTCTSVERGAHEPLCTNHPASRSLNSMPPSCFPLYPPDQIIAKQIPGIISSINISDYLNKVESGKEIYEQIPSIITPKINVNSNI